MVKTVVLPVGIATALELVWGGLEVKVISVYRPYESPPSATGSLRSAACKLVENFEESFWSEILAASDVKTLIGGDFNLEGVAVDERIGDSSFDRVPYREQSSFRKLHLGNYNGASIDHVLANCGGVSSCVSSDGLYIGDHFPVVASLETGSPLITHKSRIVVTPPSKLKSSDKGGLRRMARALERKFQGDLSTYSIVAITEWTVMEEKRIAETRRTRFNPNGWSPTSRLLQLRLRILGALLKRMLDGADISDCGSMFKEARKDISKLRLSDDEEEWLLNNDIPRELPPWAEWRKANNVQSLGPNVAHLKAYARDELRLIHGGRMRRIQDAADAGKIGPMLRSIMMKQSSFSMDVIYNQDGNVTDPDDISRIVTEFFKQWFAASTEDDVRDDQVANFSARENEAGWLKLAERLGIPWDHAKEVLEGMKDKESNDEIVEEAKDLDKYIPSFDEFNAYIEKLNPNSAGGPSGLTYLLVQQWPQNVRQRVHDALSVAWKGRVSVPGWGRRWLQPIPKVLDPGLDELRPLMLVEVTRKIWVGLIMGKIADFWSKHHLIDSAQHAYIRGKGTHTAIPQLTACLEGAKEFKTDIYISVRGT